MDPLPRTPLMPLPPPEPGFRPPSNSPMGFGHGAQIVPTDDPEALDLEAYEVLISSLAYTPFQPFHL